MKKSLVSLAVLGAFASAASAQTSVTLYGIVDAAVSYVSNAPLTATTAGSKTTIDAGQLATSRWGFKGSEDLGGGLKANFALESTLANDTGAGGTTFGPTLASSSLFDRISTVGLSGGFGSVNLGRQNMLGVDSVGLADPIGFAHAGTNPNVMFSALNQNSFGGAGTNDGGSALRQNNSIKYLTPTFSGFGAAAMYGFGEKADSNANTYKGLSGYFSSGASGAALAYAKLTDATGKDLTLVGGGAKYAMSPVTLKATYVQSKSDVTNRKLAVTGLGIDYAMSAATTLTGAYYNTKSTGMTTADGKSDLFVVLGKYALSKRTTAYASLTFANAGSSAATDTGLALGLIGAGESSSTRTSVGVMHSF